MFDFAMDKMNSRNIGSPSQYGMATGKLLWVIIFGMTVMTGVAQSTAHLEADIMLCMPAGQYRITENPDRAEAGVGFRVDYFLPVGKKGFGLVPAFTGMFNKNVRFKSTNTRFFKVEGGWYSHLALTAGPAYYRQFQNIGVKTYAAAGLNFTSITDSKETVINTGQVIDQYNYSQTTAMCLETGVALIFERRVVLGLSYFYLGDLTYEAGRESVNSEPESITTQFRGSNVNLRLGLLF